MNKLKAQILYIKKRATCCSSFLVLIGILFFSATSLNGQKNEIRHYLRKVKTDTLIKADQNLNSQALHIQIPDSLYGGGKVHIKKYALPYGKAQVWITFDDNKVITEVKYKCNRKMKTVISKALSPSNKAKSVGYRVEQISNNRFIIIHHLEGV